MVIVSSGPGGDKVEVLSPAKIPLVWSHPVWSWDPTTGPAYVEGFLGSGPDDGVRFTIEYRPTCYRRGPFCLHVEVCSGENHERWGCFDEQDQPLRYYHDVMNCLAEARLLAKVLWQDRQQGGGVVASADRKVAGQCAFPGCTAVWRPGFLRNTSPPEFCDRHKLEGT